MPDNGCRCRFYGRVPGETQARKGVGFSLLDSALRSVMQRTSRAIASDDGTRTGVFFLGRSPSNAPVPFPFLYLFIAVARSLSG